MAIPIDKYDREDNMRDRMEIISDIEDAVDFETIHAHMVLTDWEYKSDGVPEIADLKRTVRTLVRKLNLGADDDVASTGGFKLRVTSCSIRVMFDIA